MISMIRPPVVVFGIEFKDGIPLRDPARDRPVNDALPLCDPVTDEPINYGPHWIRDTRNEPVAYVRGSSITLEVVFLDVYADNLNTVLSTVYALGNGGGICQTELTLSFDYSSGLSKPVRLKLAAALPDIIGVHEYSFAWYVTDKAGQTFYIGSTTHTLYTTWKPMLELSSEHIDNWVYEPVMRWSCRWATGQHDDKAICDALIKQLPLSGLIYGLEGSAQTVRGLLLRGGGMCGAWYRFFQQLARCQGVHVFRRDMTIVTEAQEADRVWNGAVATAGGINQPYPDVDPYRFFEDNLRFPIGSTPVRIDMVEARRYVYEGEPCELVGVGPSTHAVNFFIDHDGQVYLYDPSFAAGPYRFDGPVPEAGEFMEGEALAKFKTTYLDKTFPYLMGSICNGNQFYKTDWSVSPPKYGLLVRIDLISPRDITIGWSIIY